MGRTRLHENQEAKRLWSLPEPEFNAWRRANDLPRLLAFFREALPHFPEWLSTYAITDDEFAAVDHTSRLLVGAGPKYITDITQQKYSIDRERSTCVTDLSSEQIAAQLIRTFGSMGTTEIHSSKKFEPYFSWLRRTKHLKYFRIYKDINKGYTDDLHYMSWHGGDLGSSRALLFHSHPVLKLGGATIPAQQLDERNLDFVDLDGLVVTGTAWGRRTCVAYASCREIEFQELEKPFFCFEKCDLERLVINNSQLFDIRFDDCSLGGAAFSNSRIRKATFTRTFPGIRFDNCDLEDLSVTDMPRAVTRAQRSEAYKKLRFAFQQRGNRIEASQYYYLERLNELLSCVWPVIPHAAGFPWPASSGYRDLYDRWRAGQYSTRTALMIVGRNALRYVFALHPRFLWPLIRIKARGIRQAFDWAVWGFGERPSRVFLWMALVVAAFAGRYYFGSHPQLRGNIAESIYCSAFNFATMGCDYKSSIDSFEGVLGAILLAILVAGFSNKTRY